MQPLRFEPLLKQIRWGGTRLGTVLGKPIGAAHDYAESWEICDHGSDQSVVADGPYRGWTLHRLLEECGPELLGKHAGLSQFPLLIKFLDANDRLSVQVHPNDIQAHAHLPGERGKTEAWVIIHADPGSKVFAGLKPGVDAPTLKQALADGRVEDCLHAFEVQAGHCIFIPAGTVHAIGEGVLLAEVQQSSDLTFRLYDWGRVGTDGKPRQLHIDESLACIDFDRGPISPIIPPDGHDARADGHAGLCEELVRCPYFTIRRYATDTAFSVSGDHCCQILIGLQGRAQVECAGSSTPLAGGQSLLIPASATPARVIPDGSITLLQVDWE